MKLRYYKRVLNFIQPVGTSRGVLREKPSWILEVWNENDPSIKGIGECSVIPGLSPDFSSETEYEEHLNQLCNDPQKKLENLPSIKFGFESALLDLMNGGKQCYYDNDFYRGSVKIPINGLIWMGSKSFMLGQIHNKLKAGFTTIKMKIGAISIKEELDLLEGIRKEYTKEQITLRVDANGSFNEKEVVDILQLLKSLDIHSIEQPIAKGNWKAMRDLCDKNIIPIGLDEELIGINTTSEKRELLRSINPQYLILKPSLHGGLSGTEEWIDLAREFNVGWWITSALESNIGLNTICQFTAEHKVSLPQGLGTGSLFFNNFESELTVDSGYIFRNIS